MLKALVVDFHDDKNISKKVVDAVLEVVINVVEIHHKDTSELKHFYCEEKYDVVFFIFNGKKEDSGFVRAELNKADYPRDANKEDEIHAYYESRTKCLISEYNITEYSYLLSAVDALFNTPLVRTMELGKLNTLLIADYSDIGDALIRIASM